ncbi:DUF4174 domain-containing protein [Thalassotalea euphylliae]|uniref:DUF4174 domain-containing protein n=1 Tax=Thalassotalea euphylliae TaxID=1655234 RepID=UPI0036407CF8
MALRIGLPIEQMRTTYTMAAKQRKYVLLAMIGLTAALALSGFAATKQAIDAPESIAEFAWQNRLILINVDSQPPLMPFMRELDYQQLTDRKLVVYALINKQSYQILPSGVMKRTKPFDKALQATLTSPNTAVVIGLDGGQKAEYEIESLNFERISALIDTMPMRQSELGR